MVLLISLLSFSCKFAPSSDMGDTVAAKIFEPIDTALLNKQLKKQKAMIHDSANIFVVGEGSTREMLQLISYPSRRDTASYGKKRPLKVTGNADFGHIVRIGFVMGRDSTKLVKTIDEIKMETNPAPQPVVPQ